MSFSKDDKEILEKAMKALDISMLNKTEPTYIELLLFGCLVQKCPTAMELVSNIQASAMTLEIPEEQEQLKDMYLIVCSNLKKFNDILVKNA